MKVWTPIYEWHWIRPGRTLTTRNPRVASTYKRFATLQGGTVERVLVGLKT